jgi:hypothetical protein
MTNISKRRWRETHRREYTTSMRRRIKAVNCVTFIKKRPVKTLRLKWTRSKCNNSEIHVGEGWFVHDRCCSHSELLTKAARRHIFPDIIYMFRRFKRFQPSFRDKAPIGYTIPSTSHPSGFGDFSIYEEMRSSFCSKSIPVARHHPLICWVQIAAIPFHIGRSETTHPNRLLPPREDSNSDRR